MMQRDGMIVFGIDVNALGGRLRRAWPILAVLLFFFISGACGLLYQVVWTRKLVLLFGTTAYAVSTVLTVFFIGLGVGSLWGGRLADRASRPLLIYGIVEVLIGLWAIAFILLIGWGESVVVAVLHVSAFSRTVGIALRALLAVIFLIVPVVLMGATLPILAKFVSGHGRVRGLRIGALYSVNTFGAVAGCAATGFYLLPHFGYTRTTLLGAAANAVIGLLAMLLSGFGSRVSYSTNHNIPETQDPRPKTRLPLVVFAISGFCALALEVLWTRLLTIVFIGTTYAFTTMLTTLLCGIALGSAVASVLVDRVRPRLLWFGLIEAAVGIACSLMLPVFAGLPARLQEMQVQAGYRWEGILYAKFLLSFAVLFAPTFLFGMTFPVVVKTLTSTGERLGRDIGRLYSANTFGGVLGAVAGGFVLIPMFGTHWSIVGLSYVLVAAGMVLILACSATRPTIRLSLILVLNLCCIVMYAGTRKDVSRALNKGYVPSDHVMMFYREGVEGTVAVSGKENAQSDLILWINAVQATASIEKGIKMNRFEGVLPLVFDRDPKTALFMCFGSGITVGTLAQYAFDRIDAVEISRDVIDASGYFYNVSLHAQDNPRIQFTIDDGRNFLLTTRNLYDVITFEPMPLALAGVSTFYTEEYYRLCLDHLTPGGLVSQWVPLHSLDPHVVCSLVSTFTAVFSEYCAWFVNADLFLVGSNQPLHIDYARLAQRLGTPRYQEALQSVGFRDLTEVVSCFFMGRSNVDAFANGGSVMTDDRPWAEFVAPKLMYQRTVDKSLDQITPYLESPLTILSTTGLTDAEAQAVRGKIERRFEARKKDLQGLKLYYGGTFGADPDAFFKEALAIDPNDYTARYYLKEITIARVNTFIRWDETDKAIAALTDALECAPGLLELELALADLYFDHDQPGLAREHYAAYVALGGKEPRAAERTKAP